MRPTREFAGTPVSLPFPEERFIIVFPLHTGPVERGLGIRLEPGEDIAMLNPLQGE